MLSINCQWLLQHLSFRDVRDIWQTGQSIWPNEVLNFDRLGRTLRICLKSLSKPDIYLVLPEKVHQYGRFWQTQLGPIEEFLEKARPLTSLINGRFLQPWYTRNSLGTCLLLMAQHRLLGGGDTDIAEYLCTVGCAMYGQYDGWRSHTSVATERVYEYARGQYSTALLGTGV